MDHFFVSDSKVGKYFEPIAGVDLDGSAIMRRVGALKDGTPFFLGPDMQPLEPLCSFFFELSKSLKPDTLSEYAYDLMDVVRFLAELEDPVDLLTATESDLVAYRRDRTELQDEPLSAASWARRRATINNFYDWAVEEGLIARRPYFKRKNGRDALQGSSTPQLDVRPLTYRQWRYLKQCGLLGLLPDGSPDPAFRRHGRLRNAAAAELAVTTGMRLREFTQLLDIEVGAPRRDASPATVRLQKIAKYELPRDVTILHPTLREIDLYRRTERAAAVRRAAPTLARHRSDLFVVTDIDERRMKVTGSMDGRTRTFRIADMDMATRRRAVIEGDHGLEPMGLFIGRGGRIPTLGRWEQVFDAAHVRTLRYAERDDIDFEVPTCFRIHHLRHTFAVYLLQQLTQIRLEEEARRIREGVHDAYLADHLALNPFLEVQTALGHRRPSSTMHYLRYIRGTNLAVARAVAEWNDEEKTYADYADLIAGRRRSA